MSKKRGMGKPINRIANHEDIQPSLTTFATNIAFYVASYGVDKLESPPRSHLSLLCIHLLQNTCLHLQSNPAPELQPTTIHQYIKTPTAT